MVWWRDKESLEPHTGIEWFLRVEDPWKVALSTDHPNGGSFLSYPQIIALLKRLEQAAPGAE